MKRILILTALVLTFAGAGVIVPASPSPPLCRVTAATSRDSTPGFYTVTISLRPECPPDAVADVRLESYVGGTHPSAPRWFRITRDAPLIRSGVPWYWRGSWKSNSGWAYPFKLPGMTAPLSQVDP